MTGIAAQALALIEKILYGNTIEPDVLAELMDLEDQIANRLRRISGAFGLTAAKLRDMLTASKRMIEQTYTVIEDIWQTGLTKVLTVQFSEAVTGLSAPMLSELAKDTL